MSQATKAPSKSTAKKIPAAKQISASPPTKAAVKVAAKKVAAKKVIIKPVAVKTLAKILAVKVVAKKTVAKKTLAAVEKLPTTKPASAKAAPITKSAAKKTAVTKVTAKPVVAKKSAAKKTAAKKSASAKPTMTALESALKVAAKRPASGLPKRSSKPVDPLKAVIMKAVEDLKAKDVIVLDVRSRTTVTDELIIATGTSTRHVKSIADSVVKACKAFGIPPIGVEGEGSAEWVLVDLGDYVVHVFQAEMREFYALEKLWGSNTPIDNSL